ncbi:substrate-binding domain-containing protein [Paenibacillus eucommiae]|uniref:Ribose transport system substrate-binding protein n=1 Tax=Paenibacillus eucommiae TaxID=1355755 RepID=A0ABS4IN31_9BACL|nr:substrate-binding domain-containing protein [Paenibacillus eucommiae]MBP1988441.1 ribose transport system substrate-binding protein [Paenibacillus eucommiae]
MQAKKMIIFSLLLAAAAGILGLLSLETARRDAQQKELTIVVILKSNDLRSEFWQTVSAGVNAAAKEFNVHVDVRGPLSEADTAGQILLLEQAITEKPDAVVFAASEYGKLEPSAKKVSNAGIPLVAIDSVMESDWLQSYISVDNAEAGRKAASVLIERLPADAKVAILGTSGGSAAEKERELGIMEVLTKNVDITHAGTRYFDGSEDEAYRNSQQLLSEFPDLAGIVALNEAAVLGAAKAVKEKMSKQPVKLVGFDSSIYEIKLLEEGTMEATVVQRPFNMGYLGVKAALQLIRGQKPLRTSIDSLVITKETMYTEENQKLLFPFVER